MGLTITRVYYACRRCSDGYWIDDGRSVSLIPDLVRDENGDNVDYIAGVSREDGRRILTVTPEAREGETFAGAALFRAWSVRFCYGIAV